MRPLAILLLSVVGVTDAIAQSKTWQSILILNGEISPVVLGTAILGTTSSISPPTWTGAVSSIQASSYSVAGFSRDEFGDTYILYSQSGTYNAAIPLGFVSQTTSASSVTQYFALNIKPALFGVSPLGDVFVEGINLSGNSVLDQLSSSGQLTTVYQFSDTFFNAGGGLPGPMTVDLNDDISVGASTELGAGTALPATYLFVTTGAVPYATPLAETYPAGSSVSIQATSSLSISYQWSLNGAAIPGATSSTYAPSNSGAYSVTASTSSGTVAQSTYVLPAVAAPPTPITQFINISTRAFVGTGGSVAIAGFNLSGSANEQVLIRGVGPTLAQFSVGGVLAQPVLSVYNSSGTQIASNTGWGTNSNVSQISAAFSTTGAFVLPTGSADSALLLSLAPGTYTAQVSGLNNTTGNALVEVYEVPTPTPTPSH